MTKLERDEGMNEGVEISEEDDGPIASFKELGLSEGLVETLDELGYEDPTPIQAKAIPPLLGGRSLLVA